MILNPADFLAIMQTALTALHTLTSMLYQRDVGRRENYQKQGIEDCFAIPYAPGFQFTVNFDLIIRVDHTHSHLFAFNSVRDELLLWRRESGAEHDIKKILVIPQAPFADGAIDYIMERIQELEPGCEITALDLLEDEYDGYEAITAWHPAKWLKALLRGGLIREVASPPRPEFSLTEFRKGIAEAPTPYYKRKGRM
ncbi:hypothetical protein HN358_03150 [Candidatus Uhrbacteria bacterium]|jgi:hypothetical protein|nr:hypothetical protein [Candidatus Uhrbacteria bacterium]MBT7717196.1 hypothetical protein [Candidatus Uhrbacteria bacterium]